MNPTSANTEGRTKDPTLHPFRRALLRGLAVVMPPLLTIVIFLWLWNTVREYVWVPIEATIKWSAMEAYYDQQILDADPGPKGVDGTPYVETANGQFVPQHVFNDVRRNPGADQMPSTAKGIFRRYIELRWLRWYYVGPIFICGLILVLYFLGKFLAAGMGRLLVNGVDRLIHSLPIVRNVYGSVKQVTDFVFSEREIEFNRVVAVEYPRKGLWSVGFVTGESMLDIRSAANEPIVSVLMPTSPMPMTGFTINVRKSETVDLNITIDQAIQFVVSCGVVVPPQQLPNVVEGDAAQTPQATALPSPADPSDNGHPATTDPQSDEQISTTPQSESQ